MDKLQMNDWDQWQTYRKDRDPPPWIKVHRRIVMNPKWGVLTDAQRGQLIAMWILAADDNGKVPADPKMLQKLCLMEKKPDVQLFVSLGFMHRWRHGAVSVASSCRHRDAPEAEAEAEADTSAFEELWAAGLRRGVKKQALSEYKKAVPAKIEHATLLASLKAYVEAQSAPQYVRHINRFIRDEMWESDHAPLKARSQSKGGIYAAPLPADYSATIRKQNEEAQRQRDLEAKAKAAG